MGRYTMSIVKAFIDILKCATSKSSRINYQSTYCHIYRLDDV